MMIDCLIRISIIRGCRMGNCYESRKENEYKDAYSSSKLGEQTDGEEINYLFQKTFRTLKELGASIPEYASLQNFPKLENSKYRD